MADIVVKIQGVDKLTAAIAHLPHLVSGALRNSYGRIGRLVHPVAKSYAPRSPTMAQLSGTLKRKRRTSSRRKPGGLEKSIMYEALPDNAGCSVFVASNSLAGDYARRIHDGKGKTWWKRGPGTVAKGSQADEKFIERAIRDCEPKFLSIIKSEMRKAARSA